MYRSYITSIPTEPQKNIAYPWESGHKRSSLMWLPSWHWHWLINNHDRDQWLEHLQMIRGASLPWPGMKLLHVCPLIKQSKTYVVAWMCALQWSSSVTKMTVCGIKDRLLPLQLHPYWIALSMNYWPSSPDRPHYWWDCQAWFTGVGLCWLTMLTFSIFNALSKPGGPFISSGRLSGSMFSKTFSTS